MRAHLTAEQQLLLQTIDEITITRGLRPTPRELSKELNVDRNIVLAAIQGLRQQRLADINLKTGRLYRIKASKHAVRPKGVGRSKSKAKQKKSKLSDIERAMNRLLPTDRQAEILSYIQAYRIEHGRGPTFAAIASNFDIVNRRGAACHFGPLKTKRWLEVEPGLCCSARVAKGLAICGEVD